MYKKNERKQKKNFQVDECCSFCIITQRVSCWAEDAVLPDAQMKHQSDKNLTIRKNTRKQNNDNLCQFNALAFHRQGNERLNGKTSKVHNQLTAKTSGADPPNVRGVCMEDIAAVENIVR